MMQINPKREQHTPDFGAPGVSLPGVDLQSGIRPDCNASGNSLGKAPCSSAPTLIGHNSFRSIEDPLPRLPALPTTRPLLLLDLDETLIHSSTNELPGLSTIARIGDLKVYARPHLDVFLKTLEPLYNLGVWTAASADYAGVVVPAIFPNPDALTLVWSRERCHSSYDPETGELRFVKDLKKVKRQGYDLAQILFIDDIPANLRKNYGNHIRIPAFTGETEDRALLNLAGVLRKDTILTQADFRRVDKRGWAYRDHL